MTEETFGRRDWHIAENSVDGLCFVAIVFDGAQTVGVDVANVRGLQTGVSQRTGNYLSDR
jgi:hypothetical protein